MSITDGNFSIEEKVNLLLKKHFNKPATRNSLPFYSESSYIAPSIWNTQVLQQANEITTTPPLDLSGEGPSGKISDMAYPLIGSNGNSINDNRYGLQSLTNSVISLFVNITSTYVSGTSLTFKLNLTNENKNPMEHFIPFNFGENGKYNYVLRDASGVQVNFGDTGGNFIIDNGYITFYSQISNEFNIDANNPPNISYYKYTGEIGTGSSGITVSESDNSPILENTTIIQFNTEHADFVINQNGSNTVNIDLQPKSFAIGNTYGSTKPAQNNLIIEGKVGIGISQPEFAIHANGLIWSTGTGGSSDIRWKTNFSKIKNPLEDIFQIRGLYFDWKHDDDTINFPKEKQIGVIAQEVELVYPELVYTDKRGYKSVAYDKLTAVLLESIKELKYKNDFLEEKYNNLEHKVNSLIITL
jgi:hypothetical protein